MRNGYRENNFYYLKWVVKWYISMEENSKKTDKKLTVQHLSGYHRYRMRRGDGSVPSLARGRVTWLNRWAIEVKT